MTLLFILMPWRFSGLFVEQVKGCGIDYIIRKNYVHFGCK